MDNEYLLQLTFDRIDRLNKKLSSVKADSDDHKQLSRRLKIYKTTAKYLSNPESIYKQKYYKRHLDQYRNWQIDIAEMFVKYYHIKSVADFGCGVGSFLEGCLKGGAHKIRGYELNRDNAEPYIPAYIKQYIEKADITSEINVNGFDCSWSVEVAEHIPEELSNKFIDNLCRASNRMIFFTAARPGQPGTGHINCQPKQYWIGKISKYGFEYDQTASQWWSDIWKNKTDAESWVIKNFMLFKKDTNNHKTI